MLGSAGLDTLLASVLDLPVRIQGLGSETKSLSLHVAGPTLARLFAEATRKVGSTYPPIAVRAVAPTLLVQYRESDVEAIPGDAITIDPKLTADVPLAFLQREHGGQRLGIWLLREGAAGAVQERNLRMALLRVHAEYHALRHVLALLLDKTLTYIRGSAEGERLQEYLNRATTMLPESYPGAEPDKAIAHVLHAYDAPMPAADRALIADALAKVRRQIAKKVERYLETGEQAKVNALPTARQIYIFVSYSHRDEAYVNESTKSVLTFLGGLEREGFVFWHDQKLYASELWDDRIKEELTRADIALILVSQHFLNSKYIRETEMPALLASRQMAGLSILPLMVSASDWQSYPWLVATQHVPRTGTLATEYRNSGKRDELYLEVLKTIRRIGAEKRTLSGGVGSS